MGNKRRLFTKSSMRSVALMMSSFKGCTLELGSWDMLRRKGTTRDNSPANVEGNCLLALS